MTNSKSPGSIDRFTTSGAETDFPSSGLGVPANLNITSGPDGALWVNNLRAIGRMTTTGSLSVYSAFRLSAGKLTAGPDGALWFANGDSVGRISTAKSVVASPDQGTAGTAETITGAGYNPGETIVANYLTGLTSAASVQLCSTTTTADGTFTCTATIPTITGNPGIHTIAAHGTTSKIIARTTFLVTTP